ncbi:MAG: hypothetical protein AMXMBFR20_09980 [Planctomycetia bacterium]|nr:tetratricopeptide repeat protein [Planctomycetota bacterium]
MWRGSHHDLAMQVANAQTVLGNFDDGEFKYHEVTSRFFKKDGKFFVQTDGPDGTLQKYEISYTFGIDPLQQYLIGFPDGRYQALNVCWDTRPKEQGGQRWFHLYPDENVGHDDILHWTGPYQNWNHMCAECHSTNVRKNYDAASDRFTTSWSEINVSCESCHGPGSEHVAWAQAAKRGMRSTESPRKGLVVQLKEPRSVSWNIDPRTGVPRREPQRTLHVVIEMCARCHSRRGAFSEDYVHGGPLMDTHRPTVLDAGLYEPDGQIRDEVYEYQSFLQSKMYAAGVTCTDCHNPHSLKIPAGNTLCATCHPPEKFDTAAHHFHKVGGPGSRCVECHAPTRNYMVVHARHDHSFRVPRPDLSAKIGAPNACNGCHTDRTTQWAADATVKWWGTKRAHDPHYGEALHAGIETLPGASLTLSALADDATKPGIVRATAVALLGGFLGPGTVPTLERALQNRDPLVRAAGVSAIRAAPPEPLVRLVAPLLNDPVRMVRIDAARALATAPAERLTPNQRKSLVDGMDEYRRAQLVDADRAEAHLNLGSLHTELGELDQAEREYRIALKLSPRFAPTYVNLADLYRVMGREDEAERTLRTGLNRAPDDPALHHSLGLTLARRNNLSSALKHLARAAELMPDHARYAYVYGIALQSTSRPDLSLAVLKAAYARHPGDRDLLIALATISRDSGDRSSAIEFARKLVALDQDEPGARSLLAELEAPPP